MKTAAAVLLLAALLCGCNQKPDPRLVELEKQNAEQAGRIAVLESNRQSSTIAAKSNLAGGWLLTFGYGKTPIQLSEDADGRLSGKVSDQENIEITGLHVGEEIQFTYSLPTPKPFLQFNFKGKIVSSAKMAGDLNNYCPGVGNTTQLWVGVRQ